jgi:hypothetical protein
MHELLLQIALCFSALGLAFFAGLKWRDRRREIGEEVLAAAVCQLDERVAKVETVLMLSTDV